MKKLTLFLTVALMSSVGWSETCTYTKDQEIVRSAENLQDIRRLPSSVNVNAENPCGGTLLQLAVIRGNPSIFNYLADMNGNFNAKVSLAGYEIPDAPDTIPFVLFAARYSSSSSIIDYMINKGADFKVKDSKGHDVFWYFDQNPVLRQTYLTKKGYAGLIPLAQKIAAERRAYMGN